MQNIKVTYNPSTRLIAREDMIFNSKFDENLFGRSLVVTCGQKDGQKDTAKSTGEV
jgi:hypothetical protein